MAEAFHPNTLACRANLADDARLRTYEDYQALYPNNSWLQVTDEQPFEGYFGKRHLWVPRLSVGSGDGVKLIGFYRDDEAGFILPQPGGRWWAAWQHPMSGSWTGWHHPALGTFGDGNAAAVAFDVVYELEQLTGNTDRCKD